MQTYDGLLMIRRGRQALVAARCLHYCLPYDVRTAWASVANERRTSVPARMLAAGLHRKRRRLRRPPPPSHGPWKPRTAPPAQLHTRHGSGPGATLRLSAAQRGRTVRVAARARCTSHHAICSALASAPSRARRAQSRSRRRPLLLAFQQRQPWPIRRRPRAMRRRSRGGALHCRSA